MSTIDKTGGGVGARPHNSGVKSYVMSNTIDLTGVIPVANDIYQALAIPANTLVMNVKVKFLTAMLGTSGTLDIGDGTTADGWDAAIDAKTAAGTFTHSVIGTDTYAVAAAQGKFYAAADTIDVKIKAIHADATAGAKFTVYATCVAFD